MFFQALQAMFYKLFAILIGRSAIQAVYFAIQRLLESCFFKEQRGKKMRFRRVKLLKI